MIKQQRAEMILKILRKNYKRTPDAFVKWRTPLELVVGTVLSAQCTDKKVNEVTATLFKKYKTPKDYARADINMLESEIRPTGFYKTKTRHLQGIGEMLMKKFKGKIPKTRAELMELPGVAFKSANLIMAKAFGTPTGIAVDTHVSRIAPRLGLAESKNREKQAAELEKLYSPKDWLDVNEFFIIHGRATCVSRKPRCPQCPVKHLCPSAAGYIKEFWS